MITAEAYETDESAGDLQGDDCAYLTKRTACRLLQCASACSSTAIGCLPPWSRGGQAQHAVAALQRDRTKRQSPRQSQAVAAASSVLASPRRAERPPALPRLGGSIPCSPRPRPDAANGLLGIPASRFDALPRAIGRANV